MNFFMPKQRVSIVLYLNLSSLHMVKKKGQLILCSLINSIDIVINWNKSPLAQINLAATLVN